MADIKLKDINKLETWNPKELRKLRMTLRNRISAFENSPKPADLSESSPLANLDVSQCKELLEKVIKAEN